MSGAIVKLVKLIFGHGIKFSRLKKYYRRKVFEMALVTPSLCFAFKISLQPNLSKTESSEGKSFVWDPNCTKVKNDGAITLL